MAEVGPDTAVPRVAVPVVLQTGFNRCAHACLAMIARHYGVEIGSTHWVRNGDPVEVMPSVWDLVSWAGGLGLVAHAVEFEIEEIRRLHAPAILHCRNRHFVVLEGADDSHVAIVDPRKGRVRVSLVLAADMFSGTAIEVMMA